MDDQTRRIIRLAKYIKNILGKQTKKCNIMITFVNIISIAILHIAYAIKLLIMYISCIMSSGFNI